MYSCPICGNDVAVKGVCEECQNKNKNKPAGQPIQVSNNIIVGVIAIVLIIMIGAILIVNPPWKQSEGVVISEAKPTVQQEEPIEEKLSEEPSVTLAKPKYDITAISDLVPIDSEQVYLKWMLSHTKEKKSFLEDRWGLAQRFIETQELANDRLVRAFLLTPREHFVREINIDRAYDDTWLSIGYGATITDPDVVSMMTSAINPQPHHKVLEIGTGSGYQSALLSHMSNYVYSIEIIEPLGIETNEIYDNLTADYPTYNNITRKIDDGYYGWEEYAPFDRIIVTCSIDHLPPPLMQQLAPDGIMVVPLGPPGKQYVMKVYREKNQDGDIVTRRKDMYNGLSVRFIPFVDKQGNSYSAE
ncbi:MAG: protein-L-isoaspartate O-methyltransferase [Spirochaetales bacterium]|nr:protein-L-isoaspartate O-methyltransferase [Spirochaetales bacterium]